jgi:AAA+ superfamily predicted ATPase
MFTFYYQGVPVSKKQEDELFFSDNFANGEVDIMFDKAPEKKSVKNDAVAAKPVEPIYPFDEVEEKVLSPLTGKPISTKSVLVFHQNKSPALHAALRNLTANPVFYKPEARIDLNIMFHYYRSIEEIINSVTAKALEPLMLFLKGKFGSILQAIEDMIKEGQIAFDYLWYLFPKNSKFTAYLQDDLVGSHVIETRYESHFIGILFTVTGSFIISNGEALKTVTEVFRMVEFEGLIPIKDLPFQQMTPENEKILNDRGEVYKKLCKGSHYQNYHGSMSYQSWLSVIKYKADGRIMVDPVSFNRFNPSYQQYRFGNDERDRINPGSFPNDKLFCTWPKVPGFSFVAKKWGEFSVQNVSQVVFNDHAFEQLVLDPSKKKLIKSLVQNSANAFTDIIAGKSGGLIFLLHGPPGVGKTLTAEAVSELLHRPLYCVNIGELGVTTKQLEEKLSEILEIAGNWKAVILLDEADIFLERRTNNNIERNALVGIFLRLLEYHQGCLFLTTNRVKTFDEAFHSRLSVALHYEALDQPARKKIWETLLDAAKIPYKTTSAENNESEVILDLDALSQYDLNGRQIKNIIRLAQTISLEEKTKLTQADLISCINMAHQFQLDMN